MFLPTAPVILRVLSDLNFRDINNMLLRKLYTKLTQRLGMIFLKPKVASWRYQRGSRSLADNLQSRKAEGVGSRELRDEEEEYDIPDEIEDVIGLTWFQVTSL